MESPQHKLSPITPTLKSQLKIFSFAIIIALGSLVMGYYLVLISILQDPIAIQNGIDSYLSQSQQALSLYLSIATSLFPLGGLISSFFYKAIINYIPSENKLLKLCDTCLILLAVVSTFSLEIKAISTIRFFTGFVIGISSIIVPTYLTSISPTKLTGRIGSLNQIFITIGIAIAYATGFLMRDSFVGDIEFLQDKDKVWKGIILVPIIFCVMRILGVSYFSFDCLERHIKNKEHKKLEEYIEHFYVERTFTIENLISSKSTLKTNNKPASSSSLAIETPHKKQWPAGLKKRVTLGVVLCIVNQFCGINAIIFYANQLFNEIAVGDPDFGILMSFYLGIFQIIVTVISGAFMDKFGRKFLMVLGTCIVSTALIAGYVLLDLIEGVDPKFAAISVFVHIGGFSISLGPVTVMYISEILEDVSPYLTLLWIETVIISLTSNILIQKLGIGQSFLFYGSITIVCLIYIWREMIESKGKTRSQLEEQYELKMAKIDDVSYEKVASSLQNEEE